MTDQNAPMRKRAVTAKEHLAGIRAAMVFHQELADAHLLTYQSPISKQPILPDTETPPA